MLPLPESHNSDLPVNCLPTEPSLSMALGTSWPGFAPLATESGRTLAVSPMLPRSLGEIPTMVAKSICSRYVIRDRRAVLVLAGACWCCADACWCLLVLAGAEASAIEDCENVMLPGRGMYGKQPKTGLNTD